MWLGVFNGCGSRDASKGSLVAGVRGISGWRSWMCCLVCQYCFSRASNKALQGICLDCNGTGDVCILLRGQ